jgi:hypothetical protein
MVSSCFVIFCMHKIFARQPLLLEAAACGTVRLWHNATLPCLGCVAKQFGCIDDALLQCECETLAAVATPCMATGSAASWLWSRSHQSGVVVVVSVVAYMRHLLKCQGASAAFKAARGPLFMALHFVSSWCLCANHCQPMGLVACTMAVGLPPYVRGCCALSSAATAAADTI